MLARGIEPVKAMTVVFRCCQFARTAFRSRSPRPVYWRAAERNSIAEIPTIPPAQLRHAICDVGHVPSRGLVTELGPDRLEL